MPSTFESRLRDHLADDDFDDAINYFMKRYSKRAIVPTSSSNDSKDSKDIDTKIEITQSSDGYSLESYEIWQQYLKIIEDHLSILQKQEGLNNVEFKEKIELVSKVNPMLVRLMIASWEFQQFIEICKEYNETIDDTYVNDDNDNIAESKIDDDVNDNDSKDYK